MKILDYGSRDTGPVRRFRDKGYQAFNVDIPTSDKVKDVGFLSYYDGRDLPFRDNEFDIIVSNQVMEHCQLIDYYREASRVLKDTGYMILHFPTRWQPYEAHAKTWFLHWLPRMIKKYRNRPEYFNFRSKRYHKKLALKYFSAWVDLSCWPRQVFAILLKTEPYEMVKQ